MSLLSFDKLIQIIATILRVLEAAIDALKGHDDDAND